VSRDLITRDLCAQDRRKMVLRITAKGERLVRDLLPTLFSATRRTFQDLGAAELQRLIDQLKGLAARVGEASGPGLEEKRL
jgi:DNA-binding MarR family transcriptional regulator